MKATFNIGYFSNKDNKFIIRRAKEDNKTKKWTSKNGVECFTYYDLDKMGYRTATGEYKIWGKIA
jgi:hypothetical protein